jgi:putative spermidine/putrescine transport system permease protein
MSLGTVLIAEGLSAYLAPNGWFNRTLLAAGIIDQPLQLLHNFWGVMISLLITGFPFAFLLTLSYISGINPKMEEAASTLGATSWQRFRYITFPLLTPGLAITFCLNFVLAFSVFPSANLLGNPAGDSHVLAVAAAQAIVNNYDYSMASAISVITGGFELAVVALVLVMRSRLYSGSTSGGKG